MEAVISALTSLQYIASYSKVFVVFSSIASFLVLRRLVWIPFKLYVLAQYLPGIDLRAKGCWAVVTGATDGIGECSTSEVRYHSSNEIQ